MRSLGAAATADLRSLGAAATADRVSRRSRVSSRIAFVPSAASHLRLGRGITRSGRLTDRRGHPALRLGPAPRSAQIAEWCLHKDLCNKTVIPGFALRLSALTPLVENSQSPGHGSWLGPAPSLSLHGLHGLVTAGGICRVAPVISRSCYHSAICADSGVACA